MSESQSRRGRLPPVSAPSFRVSTRLPVLPELPSCWGVAAMFQRGLGGGAVGAFCSSVFPLSVGRDLAQLAAPALASLIKVPVTTAQQDKTASVRRRCPPGPLILVSQSHSKHLAGRPGAQPRNFVAADALFLLKA